MKAKSSIALVVLAMSLASIANAQILSWNLNGNSLTTPGVHFFGTTDAKDLVFKVGGIERMRMFYNPSAPRFCRFIVDGTIGSTGLQAGFLMFDRQTDQKSSMFYSPTPGETRLYHFASGSEQFVVKNNGNVGISTSNATGKLTVNGNVLIGDPSLVSLPGNYKLYVQGGILTEQVKVAVIGTSGWADYVFSPSYKLRSLAEVEAYIKENQHLPGVLSASELETEGLDLGAMQVKQMEKIEELTLYLIELEKKITRLETLNPVLKIDIDTTNN